MLHTLSCFSACGWMWLVVAKYTAWPPLVRIHPSIQKGHRSLGGCLELHAVRRQVGRDC